MWYNYSGNAIRTGIGVICTDQGMWLQSMKEVPCKVLVSGPPGSGKTTLIEKVIRAIHVPVTGFLTREIREKGGRVGFSIETTTGRKATLAHVEIDCPFHVGRYGVSIEALEAIAIPSLWPQSEDILIVIDEIGKMECLSPLFRKAVMRAMDSPNPVLASIARKGSPFMEGIKARKDVMLLKMTTANRDALAAFIINELEM